MREPIFSLLGLIFAVALYHIGGLDVLGAFAGGFFTAEWSYRLQNGFWRP